MTFPDIYLKAMLDWSWNLVLNWCGQHDKKAGVDYIFNYGPYAWLYAHAYLPGMFARNVLSSVILSGILAFCILFSGLALPRRIRWIFLAQFSVIAALMQWGGNDSLFLLTSMLIGMALIGFRLRSWWGVAGGMGFLALVSLIKFTFFLYGCLVLCIMALMLPVAWKRGRWISFLSFGSFLSSWIFLYLLAGQSLWDVPRYLRGSLEITVGYTEGMSLSLYGNYQLVVALVILFCWWSAEVLGWLHRPLKLRRIGLTLLVVGAGYLSWKHGFVRHDMHAVMFFNFAALAPFFTWSRSGRKKAVRITQACLLITALIAANVMVFVLNGDRLVKLGQTMNFEMLKPYKSIERLYDPRDLKRGLDVKWRNASEKCWMPKVRSAVGNGTIDVFQNHQGIALLNELNYRPRPVFQSFTAYTAYLMKKNEEYYRSPDAPDYVLLRLEPIDGRLPAMEDALALKQLLYHYCPLLVEKLHLLLKKSETTYSTPQPEESILLERDVAWDEWVDLKDYKDKYLSLSLDIRYSLPGHLLKLLLRPPKVQIRFKFQAKTKDFRIVPGMVTEGVLIQPFVRNEKDFSACYLEAPRRRNGIIPANLRVDGFQLPRMMGWRPCFFRSSIRVRVFEVPREAVVRVESED